eukprot:6210623-Pleurochrysis_carterae.AAC.2
MQREWQGIQATDVTRDPLDRRWPPSGSAAVTRDVFLCQRVLLMAKEALCIVQHLDPRLWQAHRMRLSLQKEYFAYLASQSSEPAMSAVVFGAIAVLKQRACH